MFIVFIHGLSVLHVLLFVLLTILYVFVKCLNELYVTLLGGVVGMFICFQNQNPYCHGLSKGYSNVN